MSRERAGMIPLLILTCHTALSSVAEEPKNLKTSPPADAKQQVLNLEQQWADAEHNHDAAALRRILDDKFVASFDAAKPDDKETFIKEIVSGVVDPTESQTLTDRTVIIDHDTAIVVGTDTQSGTRKGAAYKEVYRYTVTYIRHNRHWVALAEYVVQVPQAK